MKKIKTQPGTMVFKYKIWENKIGIRAVEPIKIWFGKTKWHPKNQWFLKALDIEKNEERDFALKDVIKFL